MKLPAVAIAAAFAGGIALGLHPAVLPHVTSALFLLAFFVASLILIVAGLALARMERLFPAASIALLVRLRLLACCAPCYSATAALWIAPSPPIFKRPERFTSWW